MWFNATFRNIYFLWLKTTELMLHVCLTFKYFPKVSKNKVSWHFHRKFTKFMVSFVAGRLTRLRAPGSRFCPSRHFGDRLLWAPVHGREECHKMDRPGQVHQETNLQTTRYKQRNNLFMIMLDCRVQYYLANPHNLVTTNFYIPYLYKLCRCHELACYPGTVV